MSHKITDIRILKKKVVVYFGSEKIELNPNTYTEYNLYLRKELSDKAYQDLLHFDSYTKDLNYAMNLVSKYAYTEYKLTKKLEEKKISSAHVKRIINDLLNHHLLDDKAFAIDYARNLSLRHKGPYYIKNKLKALGVKDRDIESSLNKLNHQESLESLIHYIKTLDARYTRAKVVDKVSKIKKACLSAGYRYEMVNEALNKTKLSKVNYVDAIKKDYMKFKRQYDSNTDIIKALKRKGYSYSKIKMVMEDNDLWSI